MAKAKVAPKPAAPKARKATAKPTNTGTVRVRMYRQGLGDCFLLTFTQGKAKPFHVLIDCGVILGTKDPVPKMTAVVKSLFKETGGNVDLLVATHEHWDHISAFQQVQSEFDKFTFKTVWLAWTEDPKNGVAKQLESVRNAKVHALHVGVQQLQQKLAASPATTAAKNHAQAMLDQAGQVLSFFGIDPHDKPSPDGLGVAGGGGDKTRAALDYIRSKNPEYRNPGEVKDFPDLPGVRIFVLGPPKDLAQLHKSAPTSKGKEAYEEEKALVGAFIGATERAFFAAAGDFPVKGLSVETAQELSEDGVRAMPFDRTFQVNPEAAKQHPFFREHYPASGDIDKDAWRRADTEWAGAAAEFALKLDSDTNNTSLALAFELPSGDVLLFPGDAQVGNWESWHADSQGNQRVFDVKGPEPRKVTAEQLLKRTVLYKVGHHGSHNATLRDKGLELMTDSRLVALVPVDEYVSHVTKGWDKMPFDPLMHRLLEKTNGRVVQVDEELTNLAKTFDPAHLTQPVYSKEQLDVVIEDPKKPDNKAGKPDKRALYVDYVIEI